MGPRDGVVHAVGAADSQRDSTLLVESLCLSTPTVGVEPAVDESLSTPVLLRDEAWLREVVARQLDTRASPAYAGGRSQG